MSYNAQVQRAEILIQQGRFDLAEQMLRSAIAEEPDVAAGYAILALVMLDKKQYDDAQQLAERAVSLDPNAPKVHYVLSHVLAHRNRIQEAQASIDTAIAFDPTSPDFYAQKALLSIRKKQWKEAVQATEVGLQFDPDHVDCTNYRAIALTKLGRRDEAGMTIRSALAAAPEDADTHANMGWTLLHGGKHAQAAEHFREALRLEPDNAWARQGIVESLKARNIIYRCVLRYLLWISSFTTRTQLLLFVGIIIGIQLMLGLPESGPMQLVGLSVALAYMVFAITVWVSSPLFSLSLSFDRLGRLVLTDEQRADSRWMAAALLVVVILVSGPLWTGFRSVECIDYLLLLVAAGVTLNVPREAKRKLAGTIAIGVFAVAVVYWFRWYVYSGLSIDFLDKERLKAFLASTAEDDPRMLALKSFVESQHQLNRLFVWPIIGMTWFSGVFHRIDR